MIDHIYHLPQFGEDWFTYSELYRQMVSRFPSGSKFVEIGAWKGKSSAFMCVEIANSKKTIDFYCVDTFEGSVEHRNSEELPRLHEIFRTNMEPVKNYYTEMKMSSMEAVSNFKDESVDFVFIDGSHQYEDIKDDITHWLPKVKRGGVLAGHDYYLPPQPLSWGHRNTASRMSGDYFTAINHYYNTNECSAYRAVKETLGTQNVLSAQDCYIYEKN